MKAAARILFTICVVVLLSFALNPLFMVGIESATRVAALTAGAIVLVATWIATEIAFAIWETLATIGRWLFPPYGQVR